MAITNAKKMTASEFAQQYAHSEVRAELIRGEVHEMSPAKTPHGRYTMRVTLPIGRYVEEHGLGEVFAAETGFLIRHPDGTESVRAPDLAFIRADRLPSEEPQEFWDIAPDLVVEVLSPGDRDHEVMAKTRMWLDAGVRLVWIVDPTRRTIAVHRANGTTQLLTQRDTLSGEDILPGFELPLSQVFRPPRQTRF